jgi:acyl-CoA oxidase
VNIDSCSVWNANIHIFLFRYEGDNFVLDQQVVRASVKAYHKLFSTTPPSTGSLSPFSSHLRHLADSSNPTFSISEYEWTTPGVSIYLLELRAALIVRHYAHDLATGDAAVNQRVANAVTEAFVAMQAGDVIRDLEGLRADGQMVGKLWLLVCFLEFFVHKKF